MFLFTTLAVGGTVTTSRGGRSVTRSVRRPSVLSYPSQLAVNISSNGMKKVEYSSQSEPTQSPQFSGDTKGGTFHSSTTRLDKKLSDF